MASPDHKSYLQEIDLRAFSELEGAERAFASLYLSGPEAVNSLQQRIQHIRGLLAGESVEAEYFAQNVQLIENWLAAHNFQSGSLCIFACWALDYVQGIPLSVPVQDRLHVGSSPYIRPLAELQDEYENFLIVITSNESTRIIEVTSTMPKVADRVRGDVKNHVRKGGWSQQRYERRRDKELLLYTKEINEVVSSLVRKKNYKRIVLLGAKETLAELDSVLSQDVAEHVIAESTTDIHETDDELLAEAYKHFFASEREEELHLWEYIKEEYFGHGLAIVGPAETLDALHQGRVAEVIVTRDAEIAGTRCRECENVVAGVVDTCPACGESSVYEVDLIDELARQAELTSARVEFSELIPGLAEVGHVAARLRY